jgi:sulfite reductase alpha subunit-like flavoprotein
MPLATADEATGLEDVVEPWTTAVLRGMTIVPPKPIPMDSNGNSDGEDDDNHDNDGTTANADNDNNNHREVDSSSLSGNHMVIAAMTNGGATELLPPPSSSSPSKKLPSPMSSDGVEMVKAVLKACGGASSPSWEEIVSERLAAAAAETNILDGAKNGCNDRASPLQSPATTATATAKSTTIPHTLSGCELYHPPEPDDLDGPPAEVEEGGGGVGADGDETGGEEREHHRRGERARSRGYSLVSLDEMTASTASSSGLLYTHVRPYKSRLLSARYLTTSRSYDREKDQKPKQIDGQHDDDDGNDLSHKRVVELTLQLPDDLTLEYAPGDSLGIVVSNPDSAVQSMLQVLSRQGLDGTTLITVDGRPTTVERAIRNTLDVSSPRVSRRILKELARNMVRTSPTAHDDRCHHQESANQIPCDDSQRAALMLLSDPKHPEGIVAYREYVEKQSVTIVDVLRDFPAAAQLVPWRVLLGILPRLPPRYYSVSSSPLTQTETSPPGAGEEGNSLTLAFSVVEYVTPSLILVDGREAGRKRIRGVATGYMEEVALTLLSLRTGPVEEAREADTALESKTSDAAAVDHPVLRIFPKPSADFRMPSSLHTPLILIGPGTGIAPFMGFIAHRRALVHKLSTQRQEEAETVVEGLWRGGYEVGGDELQVSAERDAIRQPHRRPESVAAPPRPDDDAEKPLHGSIDVYFGCRHEDHDWLYREEMTRYLSEGYITKLCTAFSRDGPDKVYVQHLMRRPENSERIADLVLHRGARVYLCGDGNSMARDVQEALVEILASHLPGGVDEAREYLGRLKQDRRFLMDIWS